MKHISYQEVEAVQRELNDILERQQTPAEFEAAVVARHQRANAMREKKPARKTNANRSLFSQI